MQLIMFSKNLGKLSVADAGKAVKSLGLEGLDLTVREGGHILPANVRRDLPIATQTMHELGLEIPMITTAVVDADDPHSEDIFATAESCGAKYLKLGYWKYQQFGTLRREMDACRHKLEGIAKLAAKHRVVAGLHIHSMGNLTANAGVVHLLLDGLDPEHIGAYIDPGHMMIEGGGWGWKISMDLLGPRIKMVAVKDFACFKDEGTPKKYTWKTVPLSEGMVPWPEVFKNLGELKFNGPVTVHSEYESKSSFRKMDTPEEILDQTRKDLEYLRPILKA